MLTHNTEIKEERYEGIGGWLLFFCILFSIISPIIWIGYFFQSYPFLYVNEFYYWTKIIITSLLVIFGVICGILLYRRNVKGVKYAKLFMILSLLFSLYINIYSYLAADRTISSFSISMIESLLVYSAGYIYFAKSRRVRATYFVKK